MAIEWALPDELTLAHSTVGPLVEAGAGGGAVVLRCGDIAVKVAREAGPIGAERFAREAIARAIAYGDGAGAPIDGGWFGDRAVLAFRWFEGVSLDRWVTKAKAHRDGVVAAIARDVARTLARLHLLGLRHGDVKPENVAVAIDAHGALHAHLLDPGLVAPFDAPLASGTPAYFPPEVFEGSTTGASSDLYALGKVLAFVADRLGVSLDDRLAALSSVDPGARPSAAIVANIVHARPPIDAAYWLVRRDEIVEAARRGEGAPRGSAQAIVEGGMRAVAGLAGARLDPSRPLRPLDEAAARRLVATIAGPEAARWKIARALLDDESALVDVLGAAGPLQVGDLALDAPAVSLAEAVARAAMRGDDPATVGAIVQAMGAATDDVEDGVAEAALAIVRRAGRAAEAFRFAERRAERAPHDVARSLAAAEIARASGDVPRARARIAKLPRDRADVAAFAARLAFDRGDRVEAAAIVAPFAEARDPAVDEVRALLAWAAGDLDEGLSIVDRTHDADPERASRLLSVRGMLLHAQGDGARARSAFARAADLALAIGASPLEATARASAAAAAHDAGHLAEALAASDRAIGLLERLERRGDAARARLNRAAVHLAIGARSDAIADARAAFADARSAGDPRACAYARWIEIEGSDSPSRALADEATRLLGGEATHGDRLLALSYALLAGAGGDEAVPRGELLSRDVEPASARWTFWRARLHRGDHVVVDAIVRASDHEAPPTVVAPVLAGAIDLARKSGRGEVARSLTERLVRVVDRVDPHVPLAHRASFDAQPWVRAARASEDRADALGLGAGQIELLAAITRGLRDRGSLADLLRQIVDGLVLWVGVERGLLLLRAPSSDGAPRLVPRVARGLSREDLRGEQLALSTSLARRALESLEPVVAVDASAAEPLSASIHALKLRSVLAVPLVARGEVLGVVYLDDRVRRGAFGAREIAWVRLLATQAAAAVADARDALRLRRLARRAERARARVEELLSKTEGELEVAHARLRAAPRVAKDGRDPRGTRHVYSAIVGESPSIVRMLSIVDRVADSADAKIPVLISGESGSGKELVARALHDARTSESRTPRPFVAENCGAIPETLLESTLFGHVRGAFTGADRARIGLFEIAHGGTLFLDEIGEMGAAMQAKLLRVLQDGEVRPVGSERSKKVDVRVVAATHRDLEAMVRAGRFREDLFYRLAVVTLRVPSLRERPEDIPELVDHFLRRFADGRDVRFTKRALAALVTAPWPGNVRQLENEIRRALVVADAVIDLEHLSVELSLGRVPDRGEGDLTLRDQLDALERRLLMDALRRFDGNQTRAARALGVSRFGLQKMIKRLGIGEA